MTEVSSVTFQYVLKALEMKTKIPIEEMLKEIDLDKKDLRKNEKIKSYKLSTIFRYCMKKTENPSLAIHLGQSIPYQSLGLLGYLLLNVKNLKEMIEKFNTYQKLISDHLKFNFSEDKEYYKFAIYINENKYIPVPSFHVEVHLTAILSILTQILGQKVIPDKAYFAYSNQNDFYNKIFGENIFYEKDENMIFFIKDKLNIQVNNSNPAMLAYFESQANMILDQMKDNSWFSRVEKEILKNIGDKEVSIEIVSSNLNISIRTLQNYLKSESKTFNEALSNVRKKLSIHYLENTKLDDTTISILLGYSEVSSFYRAFKKWTNKTPKQIRKN